MVSLGHSHICTSCHDPSGVTFDMFKKHNGYIMHQPYLHISKKEAHLTVATRSVRIIDILVFLISIKVLFLQQVQYTNITHYSRLQRPVNISYKHTSTTLRLWDLQMTYKTKESQSSAKISKQRNDIKFTSLKYDIIYR